MKKYVQNIIATLAIALTSFNAYANQHVELEVSWPFENTFDWAVGSAHAETKYCLEDSCPLNALDFYKTKTINKWGSKDGEAEVHAVISGPIYRYDDCYAIQYSADRQYRIKYYHMGRLAPQITREGTFIEKGTYIGYYSSNKKQSLCRGGSSSSPHVHISFFKKNAVGAYSPLDLQKIKFGHFVPSVRTKENYSASCNDFNMKSELGNLVICPFSKVKQAVDTSVALYR